MDWEAVIIGTVSVIWGAVILFTRHQIMEFSREGGRGLRNRKVLAALVTAAAVFLLAAGIAVILLKGL